MSYKDPHRGHHTFNVANFERLKATPGLPKEVFEGLVVHELAENYYAKKFYFENKGKEKPFVKLLVPMYSPRRQKTTTTNSGSGLTMRN